MEPDIVQLNDIDIGKMRLVKETFKRYGTQDHSRWVFKDKNNLNGKSKNIYFKIWNPTYIRRDNILKAIEAGFLDETIAPALSGIIFHKGSCRGYVMYESESDWKLELDDNFYEEVKQKSIDTEFFHIQFSPCHVMKYNGKFGLIDLEGIFPLCELPNMTGYHCNFDYKDYENFITDLYNRTINKGNERLYLPARDRPQFRKFPPFVRVGQFMALKAMVFFQKNRGMHIHRIER
jgi:hypothetical protein